jgi:hypothetical protein
VVTDCMRDETTVSYQVISYDAHPQNVDSKVHDPARQFVTPGENETVMFIFSFHGAFLLVM